MPDIAARTVGAMARSKGRRVMHEATVGAGLPIIDTVDELIASGDRVLSIIGCPSGTMGYLFGELADVAVESLDAAWAERVAAASARGEVLRYRAHATRGGVKVGLAGVVRLDSSFASLDGTDNQFVFTTVRYRENPLVITGPGAGPTVTAAGVLNDLMRVTGA